MSVTQPQEDPSAGSCALPKDAARRHALAARDAPAHEERECLAEAVRARALTLPELADAGTVMLFASFRTELDTTPIAEWVLRQGKRLCLPRVLGPRSMAAFEVRDLSADLAPWQVEHPRAARGAARGPAGADGPRLRARFGVRRRGTPLRLRRRLLRHLPAAHATGVPWVALAFETQLVPAIDCEAHDLPVTAIVTEKRVIRTAGLRPE